MATKKAPSKGPMSPKVPGSGHGVKPRTLPLPKVSAKGTSAKKATPGGDSGRLHRRDHPPMPAARPVKRVRRGS